MKTRLTLFAVSLLVAAGLLLAENTEAQATTTTYQSNRYSATSTDKDVDKSCKLEWDSSALDAKFTCNYVPSSGGLSTKTTTVNVDEELTCQSAAYLVWKTTADVDPVSTSWQAGLTSTGFNYIVGATCDDPNGGYQTKAFTNKWQNSSGTLSKK